MEHVYSTKLSKVFSETFTIWLYVILLVVADIFFIIKKEFTALVFVSLLLSTLVIPSLYIFARYYKYSINKKLMVNDTYIGLFDKETNTLIKLRFDEIKEIIVTQPSDGFFFPRTPWNTYGFISIDGYNGLKILITSYMTDIDIFILKCIEGRVKKEQIITKKNNFPII